MRPLTLVCLFLFIGSYFAHAQSPAFQTLKEKFSAEDDVFAIGTSGFFARTILWLGGEHEFKKSIKSIHRVRLITIPKPAFEKHGVTVNGFRKVLAKDSFESLAQIRDHGDDISVYIKSGKRDNNNSYFILVENDHEVVAMEIKGFIDPERLLMHSQLSYNK